MAVSEQDAIRQNLGSLIRSKREAKGLSMEKLARLANVAHQTVYRIEKGRLFPRLETLASIAEALDLSTDDFLQVVPPTTDARGRRKITSLRADSPAPRSGDGQ